MIAAAIAVVTPIAMDEWGRTRGSYQLQFTAMSPEDAAIAYDAWLDGRAGFDYERCIALALELYARRFPTHAPYRVFATERCGGPDYKKHKMDVYCTFCRGLLAGRLPMMAKPFAPPKVARHTTGCALACLANLREMKPPGTRGLIDEDRKLPD
jgi:hypothetical protein